MKILFVCTGNTCRSPMAEGIARQMFGNKIQVESAGTHAHVRDPPAANAVRVLQSKYGVDISSHRSRSVDHVHIEDFDYIVPMADDIHDYLKSNFPSLGSKLMPSWEIDDPYGGDMETYELTASKIRRHLQEISIFLKIRKK